MNKKIDKKLRLLSRADIVDAFKKNPCTTVELFKFYLKNHRDDFSLRSLYIKALVSSNNLDEAEKELNDLEYVFNNYRTYMNDESCKNFYKRTFLEARASIYIRTGRLKSLIELYKNNIEDFKEIEPTLKYYIYKIEGKYNQSRDEEYPYLFRQIIDYKEEDFKKHNNKYVKGNEDVSFKLFNKDFPLEEIEDEIKKFIPNNCEKKVQSVLFDEYFFKYDNCGTYKGEETDLFNVKTLCTTGEVLYIYPDTRIGAEVTDLSYVKKKENKERVLVRSSSQIDRFNKRYNR